MKIPRCESSRAKNVSCIPSCCGDALSFCDDAPSCCDDGSSCCGDAPSCYDLSYGDAPSCYDLSCGDDPSCYDLSCGDDPSCCGGLNLMRIRIRYNYLVGSSLINTPFTRYLYLGLFATQVLNVTILLSIVSSIFLELKSSNFGLSML